MTGSGLRCAAHQLPALGGKLRIAPEGCDKLIPEADQAKVPTSSANQTKALIVKVDVAADQDAQYVKRFNAWVGG